MFQSQKKLFPLPIFFLRVWNFFCATNKVKQASTKFIQIQIIQIAAPPSSITAKPFQRRPSLPDEPNTSTSLAALEFRTPQGVAF